MSNLTLALLRQKAPRRAKKWHARINAITESLVAEYGTPSLGNFRDPFKEIFYIVLSTKTTERLYRQAFKNLWRQFPGLNAIANASVRNIRHCIGFAGLDRKRAKQIKGIASRLICDFGDSAARGLRRLPATKAFAYLCTLPGVGPKSALCVMMYSLDFDVFPVDAHVRRVLQRVGLVRKSLKHYQAQNQMPAFVPGGMSKSLHVALLLHGRNICTPRNPRCDECTIFRECKAAGRFRKRANDRRRRGQDSTSLKAGK